MSFEFTSEDLVTRFEMADFDATSEKIDELMTKKEFRVQLIEHIHDLLIDPDNASSNFAKWFDE